MNGKDIFLGLKYIGADLIQEAEDGVVRASAPQGRSWRRTLLIAIAAVMAALLVGCGVAYVLSMKDVRMGSQQTSYDSFSYDPDTGLPQEYLGKVTLEEEVLSFAGMSGTPAAQAAQEWFEFREACGFAQAEERDFPAEYAAYGVYTQEMKDKLDQLLQQYDLKLQGAQVPFRSVKQLFRALGVETILNDASDVKIQIQQASYYENGNLDLLFFLNLPDSADVQGVEISFCCLYYRQKDCLINDYAALYAEEGLREWNYTTAAGEPVLIVRGEGTYVWVFRDCGDRTAALRLESELTDRQVERMADVLNLSLNPQVREDYAERTAGEGETVNGYSVRLKTAQSDGHRIHIRLGVTAPEGADQEGLGPGALDLQISNENITGWDLGGGWADDGDGLDNTWDYVYAGSYTTADGSPALSADTTVNVYWEDFCRKGSLGIWEETVSQGVWSFDVSFAHSDFRQIELLERPITAKACVGWALGDGSDVYEELELTSVKLSSLGVELCSQDPNADFLSFTGASACLVMKDGSRVELVGDRFIQPVDLDQVDYLLLPDGTKLYAPQE